MEDRRTEYFSPEELSDLIRQVEEGEMLQAPAYLKRETMQRIARNDSSLSVVTISEKRNKVKLMIYSLKVGLAAAAAIAVLFLLPSGEMTGGEFQPMKHRDVKAHSIVVERLGEKSDRLCQTLSDVSNWVVSGER